MTMNMYQIIQNKKEGKALTEEEIRSFIQGYTQGEIPDYQASALLMAVCFNGMDREETVILTDAMMHSGFTVDLSSFGNRSVDKHSTGGVGDKTTLILAPIVSAAGAVVAKMSGRGLGHTGGTVDKMESIPGMKTDLPPEEFFRIAREEGICVVGQNKTLAPADQKLYALRDVTATVDSIPLIASSIMAKKLASGAKNIVLDVKCGDGAFMKTMEDATFLAQTMVEIGTRLHRNVSAFITNMEEPLGKTVGNALEVKEAIAVLKGEGDPDLTALCLSLASEMIALSLQISRSQGAYLARQALESGAGLEKMKAWISAQGGDASVIDDPSLLPLASHRYELRSPFSGYLMKMPAQSVGLAASFLGAGREKKGDLIDHGAGLELLKKPGDPVERGEVIAILHSSDPSRFSEAEKCLLSSLVFSPRKIKKKETVLAKVLSRAVLADS